MIWYALIIPIIVTAVSYVWFRHKIAMWELLVPTFVSLVVILISFYSMKYVSLHDVEYNGYVVYEARYYEYWETYVKKTCSYTTCTGTGKTRSCTTHYYDCSYCDRNPARYEMVDSGGNVISITKEKYDSLIKKWSATPKFVELNRSIKHSGSCGQDGDMYFIRWDNKIETSETSTFEVSFTNILKCNHSAFNYPVVTEEQAKKAGLYDYPELQSYKRQNTVLGLDSLNYAYKKNFMTHMNFLNGSLGAKNKVRLYTLFFVNKDIDKALLQEAYWDGGNRNEIVVCIGTDKSGNIQWVKPFSWCDNKRIVVDIREDLMSNPTINSKRFFKVYKDNITKFYHYKSFEDFNYLSFEPEVWQLILVYVLTTLVSIGCSWWCINNEYEE